ncbi:hypothetical protein M427DRAFT_53186 [Gonapodya prolifera JEL478]|uniref:Transmembrane protein 231 n=1 Tax=Gonapodya prolifera (strain JEL478) TaxID=1344416 RepID=A0A139AR86_GONPJ|nr:hypothetical protein M427DRAFT_53186 [Gonapodya prolifera JEL478]|eukprot:KXS19232.1 hypothetical protein M427DRAFT_53186 [Gonapodya prolifera JEL478]
MKAMGKQARVVTLKTSEVDVDRDGRPDRLDFQISVPLTDSEHAMTFRMALLMEYELGTLVPLRTTSLALIHTFHPAPAGRLYLSCDLVSSQRTPLPAGVKNTRYGENPLRLDKSLGELTDGGELSLGLKNWTWDEVVKETMERNFRTHVDCPYPSWSSGRAAGEPFIISGVIRYPENRIWYRPGFAETLKWGGVQYCAYFLLCLILLRPIKSAIFRTSAVQSIIYSDMGERSQGGARAAKGSF